ncbi:MAG: hypothetical protein VB141_08650, partial [Burkholderia gladioli]
MKSSPRFPSLFPSLRLSLMSAAAAAMLVLASQAACAGQAPDVPVSHRDRVYAAEQFSNTVSVT